MDELCGKRFRRHLRFTAVGLDSLLYTSPELRVRDLELIAQDMTPDTRPVGGPIDRVRDPGPENAAVSEVELVRDVVSSGAAPGISHRAPALDLAELLMDLPGWLAPRHWPGPTSHSRS